MNKTLKMVLVMISTILPTLMIAGNARAYNFHHKCGPTWLELPIQYLLNEKGSRDFPDFSDVKSIIHDSFQAWKEPCCSGFDATYIGTTPETEVHAPGPVIISFADDQFPRQFGGPDTIAITYSMLFYEDCSINQSVIVFNGADHTFYHAPNDHFVEDDRRADLQAIATHEIGHLLGLAHTRDLSASMYPAYYGGTGPRYLASDDIKGVCALYPVQCACTREQGCSYDQVCNNGICEDVPCTADDQCGDRLICKAGECVEQTCTSQSECGDGFRCEDSICVSGCPTCRICNNDNDCGDGHCLDIGQNFNKCFVQCAPDLACPGDSVCADVSDDGEPIHVCLNPDFETADLCPDSYICKDTNSGSGTTPDGSSSKPRVKFANENCSSVGYARPSQPQNALIAILCTLFAVFLSRKRVQPSQRRKKNSFDKRLIYKRNRL